MEYSEEDIVKLLKVQAGTLTRIEHFINEMNLELGKQKQFLKNMVINIRQSRAHTKEKEELSDNFELPNNVLQFREDDN